jgi:hypothetical protein
MSEAEKAKKQADETRASTRTRASAAPEKKAPAKKAPAKKAEPKEEKVETEELVVHPLPQDPEQPLTHLPKPEEQTADGPDPVDVTHLIEGREHWSLFRSKAYVHALQQEKNFFATSFSAAVDFEEMERYWPGLPTVFDGSPLPPVTGGKFM